MRSSGSPGEADPAVGGPWVGQGLLGTQLKIVLHFISKEMSWEGSIVF